MVTSTKLLRVLPLLLSALGGIWSIRPTTSLPPDKKEIHCFQFTMKFPIYDSLGNKIPNDFFEGTNRVFVYHDLAMYETSYGYDSGSVNGGPPLVSEKRHRYFVVHRDSTEGIEYEPSYPDRQTRRRLDYVLRLFGGFIDTAGKRFLPMGGLPMISSQRDATGGGLMETYKIADAKYPEDNDSAWLWYSDRLGLLPANLTYAHDSTSQLRLVQVRMQMHFHFQEVPRSNTGGYGTPRHGQLLWKVEEAPFFSRDSAAMYFSRYQNYLDSTIKGGQTIH